MIRISGNYELIDLLCAASIGFGYDRRRDPRPFLMQRAFPDHEWVYGRFNRTLFESGDGFHICT